MTRRDIPNLISLIRIGLVVPLAWFLIREEFEAALWLFALAAFSDALDGWLARSYGWSSRLGSILDPLGDKLLLATSYLLLGYEGHLPPWLVLLVIGRDLIIVGGAVAYHFLIGSYTLAPTRASKLNTALQIVLILVLVAVLAFPGLPDWPVEGLLVAVAVVTALSGLEYVYVWGRRALARL